MFKDKSFKHWTLEEDEYLYKNYHRLSAKIIALDLGIPLKRVRSRISYLKLTKDKYGPT